MSEARALLLSLVSCLFLWENGITAPTCVKDNDDNTALYLEKLFSLTFFMTDVLATQVQNLHAEFINQYAQDKKCSDRIPEICHTEVLDTPKNRAEAQKTNPEELLKLVYSLLGSNNNTLHHLVNEMSLLQGDTSALLFKARQIKEKFEDLMEGVKIILALVEEKGNIIYVPWSGLASLQSNSEDVRYFAFYNLIRCLLRDARKISIFHEVIKHKMAARNTC
ncbi:prolactin-2B1-like [Meriones unguiculatus]|uniref:prolactin-2B1-like n=1 Tax=Meriones unguiculatus TaxID=10047 RepID=UPI00293F735A|nr:prolactin-2B1-like [Meriones unguiculatus]